MGYEPPSQPPQAAAPSLDVAGQLAVWCGQWMRRNRQTRMPAPLPYSADEAARFWLQVMYPRPAPDPARWEDDPNGPAALSAWLIEARSALRGFLGLTASQRHSVVRLVQEEQIAYRGETIEHYMQIVEQTERMREDPAAFRAKVRERAQALGRRMGLRLAPIEGEEPRPC